MCFMELAIGWGSDLKSFSDAATISECAVSQIRPHHQGVMQLISLMDLFTQGDLAIGIGHLLMESMI